MGQLGNLDLNSSVILIKERVIRYGARNSNDFVENCSDNFTKMSITNI